MPCWRRGTVDGASPEAVDTEEDDKRLGWEKGAADAVGGMNRGPPPQG